MEYKLFGSFWTKSTQFFKMNFRSMYFILFFFKEGKVHEHQLLRKINFRAYVKGIGEDKLKPEKLREN